MQNKAIISLVFSQSYDYCAENSKNYNLIQNLIFLLPQAILFPELPDRLSRTFLKYPQKIIGI